jgi:hypothetical protein
LLLYTSHFQRIVKDAGRGGVWVEIGLVGLGVGGHQRMHRKKNLIMPSFSNSVSLNVCVVRNRQLCLKRFALQDHCRLDAKLLPRSIKN